MATFQRTSRRCFLERVSCAAVAFGLESSRPQFAAEVDRSISVQVPGGVRQSDLVFDKTQYTAFPHVLQLDGDELLMAFRQAPAQERVRRAGQAS